MEQFSNREIAFGIWAIVLGCWLSYVTISTPTVRASFLDLAKTLANKKIIIPLTLMAAYIGLLIFGLAEIGLWDQSQLKNTSIWAISVAALSLFRIGQIATDRNYFRSAVTDNLKLIVLLEFLVTFYSFDLWIEILIVPTMTFVAALLLVAQTDRKFAAVERLLNNFLVLFGLTLVAFTAFKLATDFASFATLQTASDFSTPTSLSLLYLPFIFVLATYVNYENAFVALRFSIKDPAVRKYAKWRSALLIGPRTRLLKRWTREMSRVRPQTKHDVDTALEELLHAASIERKPPEIPLESGWSPYAARAFLTAANLVADDYHRVDGDPEHWSACSPYLELDDIGRSNLAYYIEGNAHAVTVLKLVLNVRDGGEDPAPYQTFMTATATLVKSALSTDLPPIIAAALTSMSEATSVLLCKKLTLSNETWRNKRGYTATFAIAAP